jgi:hypothetical protein
VPREKLPPTRVMRVETDTWRKVRAVARHERRSAVRQLAIIVDAGLKKLGHSHLNGR